MHYKSLKSFTEDIKRENIFTWLYDQPDKIKGVIISPDTDGFISALLLNEYFKWKVVGFYDGKIISVLKNSEFEKNKSDFVFIDIEILRPQIKSVGHHIIVYDNKEVPNIIKKLDESCIQPNIWRDKDVKNNFDTKYPFGTFHLLLSVLYYLSEKKDIFNFDFKKAVIPSIYIDGVFKNLFNYPENCLDWLKYMTENDPNHPFEKLLNHPTKPKELMLLMRLFFNNLDSSWSTKQKRSRGKISLIKDIDISAKKIKNNISNDLFNYLDYLAKQYNFVFDKNLWPIINGELSIFNLLKEISPANKGEYNKVINKKVLNLAVTSKARKGLEYTLDERGLFG
jgi:hypothetical protein